VRLPSVIAVLFVLAAWVAGGAAEAGGSGVPRPHGPGATASRPYGPDHPDDRVAAGAPDHPDDRVAAGAPDQPSTSPLPPPARPRAAPAGPPSPAAEGRPGTLAGWARVLDRLDGARAVAYAQGDPELLRRVWAPGAHLRADAAQVAALARRGLAARGVRHRTAVRSATGVGAGTVRLRVDSALLSAEQLDGGAPTRAIPATEPRPVDVDLVATADGWRLA
jgi:hypothetical protein